MTPPAPGVPTPRELFRQLDAGLISREEFQNAMRVHAEELIEEMEDAKLNPLLAMWEDVRNRATALKLSLQHGEARVREVLSALSMLDDFPPARFLWNATHPHVPLHCFFRSRREPTFRIVRLQSASQAISVEVEYGSADRPLATRELISFRRNRRGEMNLERRVPVAPS
jgi:exonuclease VII small subunit